MRSEGSRSRPATCWTSSARSIDGRRLGEHLAQRGERRVAAGSGREVGPVELVAHAVGEHARRTLDRSRERVGLLDRRVGGVEAGGQHRHAHRESLALREANPAQRRLGTCRVGVEQQHGVLAEPAQQTELALGQRGSLGCDDVRVAGLRRARARRCSPRRPAPDRVARSRCGRDAARTARRPCGRAGPRASSRTCACRPSPAARARRTRPRGRARRPRGT